MSKQIQATKRLKFENSYYDIRNDIRKNEINIRIGGRGLGKTFSAYRLLIDNFLTNGNGFIILRRRSTEVESLLSSIVNYYPDNVFSYETDKKSDITTLYIDKQKAGFILALSCTTKYKSHYFDVEYILFDEFIKASTEKRLSDDECFTFFELLETVVRDKENVTCILLSNAIKLNNDYFRMWKIAINEIETGKINQVNDVVNLIVLNSTSEYMERKSKTLTFKASKNTKYFDYAFYNSFDTGNLQYYIKENKSKILPSKNDFYFSYQNIVYWVNQNYISQIDIKDVPAKATIFSDSMENVRNTALLDKVTLISNIQNMLTQKLLYHYIYFSDLTVAVNLAPILFFEEY